MSNRTSDSPVTDLINNYTHMDKGENKTIGLVIMTRPVKSEKVDCPEPNFISNIPPDMCAFPPYFDFCMQITNIIYSVFNVYPVNVS